MHLWSMYVLNRMQKKKQFDDEIDDRDKLEEDSPNYEGDNT